MDDIGDLAAGGGVHRLVPTVVIFDTAAVAGKEMVVRPQPDEIHGVGLAEDFLLVAVAPVRPLDGPPDSTQRKVQVGLVDVIAHRNANLRLHGLGPCLHLAQDGHVEVGKGFVAVQHEVQAAQGDARALRNPQVVVTDALADDARRPLLLEEQLMVVIPLNHDARQLHRSPIGGDAEVKTDLLHRPQRRKRQMFIACRNNRSRPTLHNHLLLHLLQTAPPSTINHSQFTIQQFTILNSNSSPSPLPHLVAQRRSRPDK